MLPVFENREKNEKDFVNYKDVRPQVMSMAEASDKGYD